jgi:hypothetical protein
MRVREDSQRVCKLEIVTPVVVYGIIGPGYSQVKDGRFGAGAVIGNGHPDGCSVYPIGAEMVKRSCVSLILFGMGIAGASGVGKGIGVVGTGVVTTVGVVVGTVVGTSAGAGVGWAVRVHPAARRRMAIVQAKATSNEVFIPPLHLAV